MSKELLKSKIMGCLPSEYIKDSITAGRIANNIIDAIKFELKPETLSFWCNCNSVEHPIALWNSTFKVCNNCKTRLY